eukprot:c14891_g1_i2.p1 GENE.c14891_g1_i2~~c14891_g1_i2.p1  ORF type:complete len:353 (+),score=69.94 c14891_g1_i2:101-1159(+)
MSKKPDRQEAERLKQKISDLRFNADDDHLSETAERQNIAPVNMPSERTPQPTRMLKGHHGKIYALSWGKPDNLHVASASQDSKAIVWNAYTMNKYSAIQLRSAWVMTIAYTKGGNVLACGGLDNMCTVYSLHDRDFSAQITRELQGHVGYLSCCKFLSDADDTQILTCSGDTTCILWDVVTGGKLTTFEGHKNDVMGISPSPDGRTFVSGGCDAIAKLWDVRSGLNVLTFGGHKSDINALQFLSNGYGFLSASDDGSCMLNDVRAWKNLGVYRKKENEAGGGVGVTSVTTSVSGRFLFAGYDDYACVMYDLITQRHVTTLLGHDSRVSTVGVSPDGAALSTGSWDCQLMVWA